MQWLHLPANYDVWLTGLKLYLDRHSGSKAELARYLAATMGIKESGAKVRVSQILSRTFTPSAETFLDIAGWLQRQTDAKNEPPIFIPLAPPPAKEPASPNWREGGPAKFSTLVAKNPP